MLKYILFFSLSTAAFGAKLDNVYLPPHQRVATAGGAGAGLQAPRAGSGGFGGNRGFGGSAAAAAPAPAPAYAGSGQTASAASQAQILRSESEINEQGFHYSFETSDGTKAEQQGRVIPGAKPEEGSIQVSGSYSYVGDDGMTYSVTYTADENGYQAQGAHLPTPPPIPEAIMKSLELIAGMNQRNNNQYSNQRSSYDADREHPGYTY